MPQFFTGHELVISPGDTAAHAIFAIPTAAFSFNVVPLSTNAGSVLVGFDAAPKGPPGLGWAPTGSGYQYNLGAVYFQCDNSADGVVVQWITTG